MHGTKEQGEKFFFVSRGLPAHLGQRIILKSHQSSQASTTLVIWGTRFEHMTQVDGASAIGVVLSVMGCIINVARKGKHLVIYL